MAYLVGLYHGAPSAIHPIKDILVVDTRVLLCEDFETVPVLLVADDALLDCEDCETVSVPVGILYVGVGPPIGAPRGVMPSGPKAKGKFEGSDIEQLSLEEDDDEEDEDAEDLEDVEDADWEVLDAVDFVAESLGFPSSCSGSVPSGSVAGSIEVSDPLGGPVSE